MKTGDIVTLDIITTSSDGRGIGKINNFVVFVIGACEGDTVTAKIYTVHKTYATAGVLEILAPSPVRVKSFCESSEKCGGCPLSFITYKHQLKIKKQAVCDALSRIGGIDLEGVEILDTIGMDNPFRYRNKMVFPVCMTKTGVSGGFYAPKSHDLVPLTDCLSGGTSSSVALNTVVRWMNDEKIIPYDEKEEKGTIRRVFVRTGYTTKELMIVISSFSEKLKNTDKLISMLKCADFDGYNLKSIILNVNKKTNNLVLGDTNITLWGEDVIFDELMGLSFSISPHSFFQVNPVQTRVLYETAIASAEIDNTKTVLDVYCGVGTISLSCAKYAKSVIGVEIVESAISDAKENASRNNIENAEFYCGAAETVVPKLIEKGKKPNIVILDPPRKGSDEKTLSAIIKASPERIVYVSCNPSTLARDVKFLSENGYKLTTVVPVDMFPNTSHIECVSTLVKAS